MSAPTELAIPFELYTEEPPKMVHITDDERGFPYALCGHIGTVDMGHCDDEVDCIVCNELWTAQP